jgi:hypothetical protein
MGSRHTNPAPFLSKSNFNLNLIMSNTQAAQTIAIKDRTYRLKDGSPLWTNIPCRNQPGFPLLHYDEVNNISRPLRYAVNQKSPFEDEQNGECILGQIIFENGMLFVPKENPALQAFLRIHPFRKRTYRF